MRQCRQIAIKPANTHFLWLTQEAFTVVGVVVFKGTEEQSGAVSPAARSCHRLHSQRLDEQENTNHVIAALHGSESPI